MAGLVGTTEPARALDSSARQLMGTSDWYHALDVIASVNETSPEATLVLLMGGSCAREATISDDHWAAQVERRGELTVATRNIGSRNQTFYEDVAFVKGLPSVPTIVYIGVNLGRFTSPYTTKVVSLTPKPALTTAYSQHHYSKKRILSLSKKRWLVGDWMQRRYGVFNKRYAYNLRQLDRLIRACKKRDLHPVILDLPRNMVVIKKRFYRPIQKYHQGCRALARQYSIPFVNFIGAAKFANRDFFDIAHVVEPGRAKFQRLLSDKTIAFVKRYDLVPAPEDVTLGLSAEEVGAGETVTYAGAATTAAGGPASGTVTVQKRRDGGNWINWRTARLQADGTYALDVVMTTPDRVWEFRAKMPGNAGHTTVYSPLRTLTVLPPAPTDMTLGLSAEEVAAGETVTYAGAVTTA